MRCKQRGKNPRIRRVSSTGSNSNSSIGSPIAAARFAYRSMLEEALRPVAPVKRFADMTPEERQAMKDFYERKGK